MMRNHAEQPPSIASLPESDDEALMQRFQELGDAAAFEILFARHRTGLHGFLLRLSGSASVAEEVSQQTWLKVVELAERGRYRTAGPFRTALFTMGRNRYIDEYVRGAGATRSIPLDDPQVGELPDGGMDAGRLFDELETSAELEQALAALPMPQAEVIALWMQGFELAEVARITGASWHTVMSRKRYGLEKLRRALTPRAQEG